MQQGHHRRREEGPNQKQNPDFHCHSLDAQQQTTPDGHGAFVPSNPGEIQRVAQADLNDASGRVGVEPGSGRGLLRQSWLLLCFGSPQ